MSVSYRLSLAGHTRHLVDVELRVSRPAVRAASSGDHIDLYMAAWSPGSYLIRDYARYVRELRAYADHAEVPVRKLDKQTWRVLLDDIGACDQLRITYQVYGHDLTVRTNHLDETHALIHGPATYLLSDALRDEPVRVELALPADDWIVGTGLAPAPGDAPSPSSGHVIYHAQGFDELLDSPIHASHPAHTREHTMDVLGTAVKLVIWGPIDSFAVADVPRLAGDLAAVMSAHAQRFGGRIPCERYTFVLMLTPGGFGGLEHKNCSINMHEPLCMDTHDKYYNLLELLSHEFFHVWNGKRIFPRALSRFDYRCEGYTRCLWVMEGITSYYDRYTALGASDMKPKRYLTRLAEEWAQYQAIAGRRVHSLEDASFDAWIKLYKPDESNINTTVSYYLAGGLVALTLDLEIRARSDGARSLADVLAHLWSAYGERGEPYPEDVQPLFEHATGIELGDIFESAIRGRHEPDLARALSHVALALEPAPASESESRPSDPAAASEPSDESPTPRRAWMGVILGQSDGRISQVLDHGPAARAGLSPRDRIIALDGWEVRGRSAIDKRLRTRQPGDTIELTLFRRKRLTTVTLELEPTPPRRYRIVGLDPDATQRARYRAWLGEDHPGPGPITTASKGPRWS